MKQWIVFHIEYKHEASLRYEFSWNIIDFNFKLEEIRFWNYLWVFRLDDVENPLLHTSQIWGFSPVWVRKWRFKRLGRSNVLPQTAQGNIVLLLPRILGMSKGRWGWKSLKSNQIVIDKNVILKKNFTRWWRL